MMTKAKSQFIAIGVEMNILTPTEGNDINSMLSGTHMLVATKTVVNKEQATEYSGLAQVKSNGFVLGKASLKELEGVKAELVAVVKLAIQMTTQDFTVFDGIRTVKEQQQHVANGKSQTMKSKHLDGLAVDLVPWVNGKAVWDWTKIYAIAFAMDQAATQLGCADKIRWGGAWDRVLSDFGNDLDDYRKECEAYAKRHPGKDFLDGAHFEWVG